MKEPVVILYANGVARDGGWWRGTIVKARRVLGRRHSLDRFSLFIVLTTFLRGGGHL